MQKFWKNKILNERARETVSILNLYNSREHNMIYLFSRIKYNHENTTEVESCKLVINIIILQKKNYVTLVLKLKQELTYQR